MITAKQEVRFHSRINPQTLTSAVVHGQEGWTGGSDKLSVWRPDSWRSEEPGRAGGKTGRTGRTESEVLCVSVTAEQTHQLLLHRTRPWVHAHINNPHTVMVCHYFLISCFILKLPCYCVLSYFAPLWSCRPALLVVKSVLHLHQITEPFSDVCFVDFSVPGFDPQLPCDRKPFI